MSSTGVKEALIDYAIFFNDITCMSDINCSGLSIYNSIINGSSSSTSILGNLNNLSTQFYFDIPNIKATSTTILGQVNTISSNTYLVTPNKISVAGVNPYYNLGNNNSLLAFYNASGKIGRAHV